jgi:hypothetical protein
MTDEQLYDIIGEIVIETGFQGMVCLLKLIFISMKPANGSVNVYGVY